MAIADLVREPKGFVLFRQSEPAFGIFLVRSGSVSVRLDVKQGKPMWERIARSDSIVGLPATLAGSRYSLTAVTLEESELAFVNRKALIDLVKSDSDIGDERGQWLIAGGSHENSFSNSRSSDENGRQPI